MELYGFGFNGHGQLAVPSSPDDRWTEKILTPRKALSGRSIEILWFSWCDALVAFESSNPLRPDAQPTVLYTGVGLTNNQVETIRHTASKSACSFFGSPLSDGLKGFVKKDEPSSVTFFASERGTASHTPDIETLAQREEYRIQHISVTSSGKVYVAADVNQSTLDSQGSGSSHLFQLESLAALKRWLANSEPQSSDPILTIASSWKQLISNATTSTALTTDGQVYTWTTDRRYPRCLGREADDENPVYIPCPIPYLSETKIVKVASGGYMTAALSADGELFLWGQASPGTEGELDVLRKWSKDDLFFLEPGMDMLLPPPPSDYQPWSLENAIRWAKEVATMRRDGKLPPHPDDPRNKQDREEQDEFVKCVDLKIQGNTARITDVAIGFGHIIVAAEAESRGQVLRAVFTAGQGESGQSGNWRSCSFAPGFSEEQSLIGKKVKSLIAAGWSSWVVVEAMETSHSTEGAQYNMNENN